ncbi:MAG: S-layer homology domain-containing protein [Defluviitaleaceae bacterium]|nr:S-layer homology domain-containing protein [Defluviitaleaceae bacterium]
MKKFLWKSKLSGLLVICLIAGLIEAISPIAYAVDFSVDIIVGNEVINYNDPSNSLVISIPVSLSAGSNIHGSVAVINDVTGNKVLPFSIYRNGEVVLITPRAGAYGVVNNTNLFSDTAGHWAENNIIFTSARELFSGVGGGRFEPNAPMTRAMFVQVLANIEGVNLTAYNTSRFTDVSADAWYLPVVEWAAESGLTSSVGNGRFDPEANITREQMARMLVNYIEYKQFSLPLNTTSAFNDEASINAWALDAVITLQQAGVISGRSGNIYEPQGIATRAEVATVFAQFIATYVNHISTGN